MKRLPLFRKLCFSILLIIPHVCFSAPPANDACASATTITPVTACGATGGTLTQATTTGSPTSTFGLTYDVWYKFTVPANVTSERIDVTSLGASLNNNNAFIEAFNATACGSISTTTSMGTASVGTGLCLINLTPGTVYYFRIFTTTNPSAGTTWTYNVCVSHSTTVPANNDCAGAVTLTVGTTNTAGTVANATATTGITVGCATGNPDDDVWYKFVAVRTYATVTVNAGAALNASGAMLQAFSGSCATTLNPIGCGQDAMNLTGLSVGTTYYIRVYSAGATGAGAIARAYNGLAFNGGANFYISVSPAASSTVISGRMKEVYQQTNLVGDNITMDPWEITYGPDNYLWITEAKGYRVFRMDPNTGARTTILDLSKGSTFLSLADTSFDMQYEINVNNPQGGLAGLVLHPKFMDAVTPKNYVYVSYIYKYNNTLGGNAGIFYTNRVVRFTYNTGTGKLESPVSICDSLPGSSDHNSQRMIIAPVGGTDYLFYAQGDMGAGQFGNQNRTNKAQDSTSYEGKILRFNLEADGDAGTLDKWIPNNNPYNASLGVQSAVWCIGIRNNQGFAYDPTTDILYGSSHGPYSDDEINIIQRYKNYGHPLVIGLAADNNYANCSAGTTNTTSGCPLITNEITAKNTINSSGFAPYQDPIFTAYASSPTITNIFTQIWSLTTPPNNGGWPSEGWSGLDFYKNTVVPGWKNSLVAASLKWGRLLRIKLAPGGTTTMPLSDTVSYFGGQNRFRDLSFSPDGKDVYVVMDRSTTTSGPSNANPVVPACAGCIQKYTFLGYNDNAGVSTIPTTIDVTDGTVNICNTGTTVTIDATNNNLWVPITGPDGNIMAEIKANGNNLGVVTSSFYKNSGAIRVKNGTHYLDRNITITPTTPPSTGVDVRLYISKAEYDALDADPLSGITTTADLKIVKNNDACGSNAVAAAPVLATTIAAHGANGYVLKTTVTGFSTFYFASSNLTLPLDLITFTGSLQNNTATLLKWQTQNEVNTSRFIVERSIDAVNFNAIGTVNAAGNNTSLLNYSYTDNDVANQQSLVVYYRLKITDINGAFKYSNVVTISLADITGKLSVIPNPITNEARVTAVAPSDGQLQYKVIDNAGRTVIQKTLQVRKGAVNTTFIDMSHLPSGIYFLNVNGAGMNSNLKIQKQ